MPVETLGGGFASLSIVALAFSLIHIAVVIGCAMAVAEANKRMEAQGRRPEMLSPLIWILACLVGGVLTVALYWGMHFSTLSRSGWTDR